MSLWFRMHVDMLGKAKIQTLPGDLFKHWVNLLCVAKMHDGVLPKRDEIAFCLRVPKAECDAIINELVNRKVLDKRGETIYPHKWERYQFVSDSSTERVQHHRETVKKRSVKRSSSAPETPSEQSRAEQIQSRADTENQDSSTVNKLQTVEDSSSAVAAKAPRRRKTPTQKFASRPDQIISRVQEQFPQVNVPREFQKCIAWNEVRGKRATERKLVVWCMNALDDVPLNGASGKSAKKQREDDEFQKMLAFEAERKDKP